jgi:hypothetical protein
VAAAAEVLEVRAAVLAVRAAEALAVRAAGAMTVTAAKAMEEVSPRRPDPNLPSRLLRT